MLGLPGIDRTNATPRQLALSLAAACKLGVLVHPI